ncbi:hypothetical protein ACFWBN_32270 [Streptomyces sp. NPDC059989]|uniref:hypothetical protein n=1 Tax=Streptomyces sp. NPDC059989 TaxID=3347026 RepID=UPI0036A78411
MTDRIITFSVRLHGDAVIEDQGWATASLDLLRSASPWRTFRWYRGQRHFSGSYWSATTQKHVVYESRPELSHLVYADFDPAVLGIVAQPFVLRGRLHWLRSRSAAALVDEFQQQLVISTLADVHGE